MLRRIICSLRYLFRRDRLEEDLDEELRGSYEMIVRRFIDQGMTPEEARRAARIEFEGVEQVKEHVRDTLAGSTVHSLTQDLRYAWRGLRRSPSFAAIALITLALGIGVNTAVFSVFYGVLLRPLPYARPDQLVLLWARFSSAGHGRAPVSGTILHEIELRNRSLSGVAGIWTITRNFTGDEPEMVKAARVTVNFFDLLGVRAAQGRTFVPDDNGTSAMVFANGFFGRRFASDARLLGKGVPMDRANTLIGVLPADFQLHFAPDANVPADIQVFESFGYGVYQDRDQYYIRLLGRLRPGVTAAQAQQDIDRVAAEIRAAYPNYGRTGLTFTVTGMQADSVRDVRPALRALFAGAAFILLICCVNVASLLLARASDRRKEIALRLAIGASRGRILRQLLVEGVLLCLLGGAGGVAVGWACFRGLLAIRPERLARIADGGLERPALIFAALCSGAAALLFAIVPAAESMKLNLIGTLRSGGRGWLGLLHRRAGAALVVSEVMLGFVLVTGAALAARTLANIEQVHPGFDPRNVLTFQIASGFNLKGVAEWEDQLAALPGVKRVGAISHLPLDTGIPNWYSPFRPAGYSNDEAGWPVSDLRCVTTGFFEAMGAHLLEGRYFNRDDRTKGRQVLIVDDLLARTIWPGESAIGKQIEAEHVTPDRGFVPVPSVVVGVVEHLYSHSLTKQARGQIYMPFEQSPRAPLTFVVRTASDPVSLVPVIRRLLHGRSRTAAMAHIRTMGEYVEGEVSPVSFTAVLAAVFGTLALLLAATGIYGVLNYQVSRRMPEIGIRMALGAGAGDVLRLIFGQAGALAGVGMVLGAAGALLTARWLGTLLYGVSPQDPVSYAVALVLLPAAAFLGCWRPAWRVAVSDPVESIREE